MDEELEMDMFYFLMNMKKAEDITFVLVTVNAYLAKQTKQKFGM